MLAVALEHLILPFRETARSHAIGNPHTGSPTFTAFVAENRNVLSWHDDLSDLRQTGGGKVPSNAALSYMLLGWFRNPQNEPAVALPPLLEEVQQATGEQTRSVFDGKSVLESLRWTIDGEAELPGFFWLPLSWHDGADQLLESGYAQRTDARLSRSPSKGAGDAAVSKWYRQQCRRRAGVPGLERIQRRSGGAESMEGAGSGSLSQRRFAGGQLERRAAGSHRSSKLVFIERSRQELGDPSTTSDCKRIGTTRD